MASHNRSLQAELGATAGASIAQVRGRAACGKTVRKSGRSQSCIRPPGRESWEGRSEIGQPVAEDDGEGDGEGDRSGVVDIAGPISMMSFPVFASRNSHFVH